MAGGLEKNRWGDSLREQNRVIFPLGISLSLKSSYGQHPFKIIEYESKNTDSNPRGAGGPTEGGVRHRTEHKILGICRIRQSRAAHTHP